MMDLMSMKIALNVLVPNVFDLRAYGIVVNSYTLLEDSQFLKVIKVVPGSCVV